MSKRLGAVLLVGMCGLALALLSAQTPPAPSAPARATATAAAAASHEDAYRATNLGVAYLEQYNFDSATKQFTRALEIDPALLMARVNLAIALLYTPDLPGATREAQAVLQRQADEPHAHYVLGLVARSDNRVDDGVAEFKHVLEKDAQDVGALVNLGQLLMQRREYADAVALFRRAAAQEPFHVTATYNLAVALTRAGQTDEGQRMTQQFQKLRESGYGTTFSNAYLEQGHYAEAITSTGAEPELVDPAMPDVTFAPMATIPAAAATPATGAARASSQPAGASAPAAASGSATTAAVDPLATLAANEVGGGVTLADLDGDGDLDLLDVSHGRVRVFRNDNGTFTDVTAQSGIGQLPSPAVPVAAIAGDYDNDQRKDVFVLGYGANALYRQTTPWHFEDRTAAAGVSTGAAIDGIHRAAALVDVDHDGDLDLFLTGLVKHAPSTPGAGASTGAGAGAAAASGTPSDLPAASNVLLRNNGDGTFTDNSANAKITAPLMQTTGLAPTDYDNRRDIDLLLVAHDHPPVLFRNMRDGTFQDVAKDVGLTVAARYLCVAAGDVNKDGFTDFFFGRSQEPGLLMLSDGAGHFRAAEHGPATPRVFAAQFIDIDNDGLLDLVTASQTGLSVWRNLGRSWVDVSDTVVKAFNATLTGEARVLAFAAGDINGDGATDLVVKRYDGSLAVLANRGGTRHPAVRVTLAGRVSNRDGVGSKVEMRAGSLWQKLESSSVTPAIAPADLLFGLGTREKADVVRVLWPSGVLQAEPQETQTKGVATVAVHELDRKPSSCPFLFTWNGQRFEFITDFMGGGEMGDWQGPGEYSTPDPEEYTRIRGDQLQPRDGRFEIRVTNELEETLYADRFELLAIDHPAEVLVHPHEGLFTPPVPAFELYAAGHVRPPRRVMDDAGRDMTARARDLDRQFLDAFPLEQIRGYAKPHDVIIALDASANGANGNTDSDADAADLLLLTGWTDYAFSSDNVAATQAGLVMMPPSLDVLDTHGHWQTVVKEIGIPVGRPQTIVVDLKDKWLSDKHVARIRTNMRIYWDQIQVATRDPRIAPKITRLDPITADLHWRGFSAEATRDAPFTYDYARVSRILPWKQMPGRYTREGDVLDLLRTVDDMFVVSRPGDEIALSFDAAALPPLPRGWTRTYLLHSDGYSKEMNVHSASPDFASPMPFHTMTHYPYQAPEAYPLTPARQRYIDRYNTRVVGRSLPPIETALQQ
jgi:Tfp pilus assembly protein PilF